MAGVYNFKFIKGEPFNHTLTWTAGEDQTPVNITDYSAVMIVNDKSNIHNTYIVLTTDSGGYDPYIPDSITLEGLTGKITLSLTTIQSDALIPGDYTYQLKMINYDGSYVKYLLEGDFIIQEPLGIT